MYFQAILAREIESRATVPGTATPFTLALTPTVTERSIVALNVLMFCSLICSLSATMFAVIIKQWLHDFRSLKEGQTTKYIARRNLYLFINMNTWHIASIIGYLFILLQVSAALFFASLLLLVWHLHPVVAIAASVLVGSMLALAITSMVIPVIYSSCCYISPPTYQLYALIQRVRYVYQLIVRTPFRWIRFARREAPRWIRRFPYIPDAIEEWDERERHSIAAAVSDLDCLLIVSTVLKPLSVGVDTKNEPSQEDAIIPLILSTGLRPEDFLTQCFQHVHTTMQSLAKFEYRRSTISMDFWIASLLKIAYTQIGETRPVPKTARECIAALKYIKAAYHIKGQRSPARDQRLLLALSLSAHHESLECRKMALQLLYLHLRSGDMFKRSESSWQHIRIGMWTHCV